jgi:hypothetical protein
VPVPHGTILQGFSHWPVLAKLPFFSRLFLLIDAYHDTPLCNGSVYLPVLNGTWFRLLFGSMFMGLIPQIHDAP